MSPKNIYYERCAQTIISNLQKRRMEGYYYPTAKEAVEKALSFLTPGCSACSGGSMTLQDTGMMDALRAREDITFIDRESGKNPEEMLEIQRRGFSCDYFFMSTNAITMDGELVNTDGTGNRVAALIYGPKNVCIRLNRKTPCSVTGKCGNCLGDDSICSQTVITRRSGTPGRIKVILVGEELGY